MKSAYVTVAGVFGAMLIFSPAAWTSDAAPATSWGTVNLNYAGDRFADLADLNSQNVGKLGEVCRVRVDSGGALQSGLVLVDGLLYLTTRLATVALDPTDCSVVWKSVYTPEAKEPLPNARGPAFGDGRIFRGTTDCRVLAMDAKSGALLWKVNPCDPARGETFAAAPIVWKGKVYIGIAGGDFGIRGRMFAFDAKTGREVWRFNTVPAPGEFGADTWTGASAETGGGGSWSTYALDPDAGELFVPVGNPGADFDAGPRAGSNLFTNSLVVLDANTGVLKWWYQLRARDDKDYDLGAAPVLFTLVDGTPAIGLGSKDGHLYVVNRRSHKLLFKTPVTTVLNQDRPVTTESVRTCPSVLGGVEWNGPAYDALHKAIVVGAVDWCADIKKLDKPEYKPGEMFMGGTFTLVNDPPASGWITSVDPQTGKVRWRFHAGAPVVSGITPTAGGLVFAGDMAGNLYALNSNDGTVLFKHDTGGAIAGGVITYRAGDVQYVAATSGNVSRFLWGETGLPSVVIFREGGAAAATASKTVPAQTAAKGGPRVGDTDLARGALVFSGNCSTCHGAAGEGMTGPSLKAIGKRLSLTELSAWIMNPVAARNASNAITMPRLYPSPLTEQDVFDVAAFVGTL
jgi:PQQ-dependent dehydrogenase (methanol/ethanol family)